MCVCVRVFVFASAQIIIAAHEPTPAIPFRIGVADAATHKVAKTTING